MAEVIAELAPHFYQVGFVIRDIEASEQWFQRTAGVPSFTRLANMPFREDCFYRGEPADNEAHLSIGFLGDIQIELIEPVRGQSIYSEFLDAKGPGLHHLAYLVPEFDDTVTSLKSAGLECIAEGQVGGPGSRFAYFDSGEAGASVIEILGFDEATRGFMEQMKG